MGDLNAFYDICTCPSCTKLSVQTLSVQTLAAKDEADWQAQFSKAFHHVLKRVYKGTIKETDLDNVLYKLTMQYLSGGAGAGFNAVGTAMEAAPDQAMIAKIRKNISVFSGAKTYKQLRALNDLLLDDKGDLKSFQKFKADTTPIYGTYNKDWLRAEYNHAVAAATSAARWHEFQADKEVMHALEYSTVGDKRVRSAHELLDGIVRPIDDDFWKTYYPPNGWNCRCRVLQSDDDATDLKDKDLPALKAMFNGNVALDGIVFPDNHPYFKVSTKVRGLIDALAESELIKDNEGYTEIATKDGKALRAHETHTGKEREQNIATGLVLLEHGYNVSLLPNVQKDGISSIDARVGKNLNEFKLTGTQSPRTLQDALRRAIGQFDSFENKETYKGNRIVTLHLTAEWEEQNLIRAFRGQLHQYKNLPQPKVIDEIWVIDHNNKLVKYTFEEVITYSPPNV